MDKRNNPEDSLTESSELSCQSGSTSHTDSISGGIGSGFGGLSSRKSSAGVVERNAHQQNGTKSLKISQPVLLLIFGTLNIASATFVVVAFATFVSFDRWRRG